MNQGNSPVTLELHPAPPERLLEKADTTFAANAKNWAPPFFISPREHHDTALIRETCAPFLDRGLQHVIVVGTGGSIQSLLAVEPLATRSVHPVTSSRPVALRRVLQLPRDSSVVVPISRGGKTLDVNATLDLLEGFPFLGLSSQGPMHDMLVAKGCPILDVPDLSGRFAGACTTVGLVPAYLAGIDIDAFVDGQVNGYGLYGPQVGVHDNPAKKLATWLVALHGKGYRNVFSMPYSSHLEGTVGLFVQEISESTGKEGKGLLGTSQEAPLCQHSVLELLLGGPKGHTVPLLWVLDNDPCDVDLRSSIPDVAGKTGNETILYQANATFEALLSKGLPSAMISLSNATAAEIGHLIAFVQSTVYYSCLLLDVDWQSNPNVLIGKKICNEAMAANKSWKQMLADRKKVAETAISAFME